MITRAAIDAALDRVVDPCSNALGEPLGLAEMGLAHSVTIDDEAGSVHVTVRLTAPCCAYGPTMADAARSELEQVAEVRSVVVDIDHGTGWTPAEITPAATARLELRRRRTVAVTGIRPFDWSTA